MNIKSLVKDNFATFSFYRNGILFYNIEFEDKVYEFPVPVFREQNEKVEVFADTKDAGFMPKTKAIFLMRWIRKAIENEKFELVSWKHMEETNT